ncbi:hypothetical protein KCP71_13895 [Salmonella enterica subsp. enterica]|nr:hypothetical protein KCP71_13895 [Salmonella enterica subsp. enterica]
MTASLSPAAANLLFLRTAVFFPVQPASSINDHTAQVRRLSAAKSGFCRGIRAGSGGWTRCRRRRRRHGSELFDAV